MWHDSPSLVLTSLAGHIRHVRVVFGPSPSKYNLLLLFQSVTDAVVFREHFHSKPLSALVCRLLLGHPLLVGTLCTI